MFVDTVPPRCPPRSAVAPGGRGDRAAAVSYRDAPPAGPRGRRLGRGRADGQVGGTGRAYERKAGSSPARPCLPAAGLYRVTVMVTDQAGNAATIAASMRLQTRSRCRAQARLGTAMIRRAAAAGRSVLVLALAGRRRAAPRVAAYAATPPTAGRAVPVTARTGATCSAATWLYRADTGDVGLAQGWWRDVASTDGWAPSRSRTPTTPATSRSQHERLRRLVPPRLHAAASAFARYVPKADRHWMIEFESVNYSATVWLNGHQLGTHARRLPAVRVRPDGPAARGQPADRPGRRPAHGGGLPARPGRAAGGTSAGSSTSSTCGRCSAPTSIAGPDPPDCSAARRARPRSTSRRRSATRPDARRRCR